MSKELIVSKPRIVKFKSLKNIKTLKDIKLMPNKKNNWENRKISPEAKHTATHIANISVGAIQTLIDRTRADAIKEDRAILSEEIERRMKLLANVSDIQDITMSSLPQILRIAIRELQDIKQLLK